MSKRFVGEKVTKVDARGKVTGEAKYTEDLLNDFDDLLYIRVLRAPHPHAYLRGINVEQAKEVPGVIDVFTAADFPELSEFGLIIKDQPVLVGIDKKMRFLGDALALVVAENDTAALEGREKIQVKVEELEVVDNPLRSMEKNCTKIHEDHEIEITHYIDPDIKGDNILSDNYIDKGDVEKGFAEADKIIEREYETQFVEQLPLQVEKGIADYDQESGEITIWAASQWLHDTQADIAQAMSMPKDKIRIKQPVIGGAFGKKEDISVHIHLSLVAKKLKRPVQLIYNREESMIAQSKRHPQIIRHKTGVTSEGKLTAWETELIMDTGAYASSGPAVIRNAMFHCTGPYKVPNVRAACYAVYTNNTYCGAMRGFGATQMGYSYDNHIDVISQELGMDPLEFRLKNAYETGSITPGGEKLNFGVNVQETISEAQKLSGWKKKDNNNWQKDENNCYQGRGVGTVMFGFGYGEGFPDHSIASIEPTDQGKILIRTSAADVGQGIQTVAVQIASEVLKLGPEYFEIVEGDTHTTKNAGSSSATRQTYFTGHAVKEAAEDLLGNIYHYASKEFTTNHPEMGTKDGKIYSHVDPEKEFTIWELKEKLANQGIELAGKGTYFPKTYKPDPETGQAEKLYVGYSYHTQVVDVKVDAVTGLITVEKVYSAIDAGKAINPAGVEGQVEGGTVQGLGMALMEEQVIEEGRTLNADMSRYLVPTAVDCPEMEIKIVENEDTDGPFGAKGIGEPAMIATAPAIINAIYDAIGVRFYKLPVTPEKIKAALEN